MNLQQLRHFVAVAEELHFGRAAQRVGIAQPPLSQSIRRLEDSLGCKLFTRSRQKVELTAAGEALLQHAPGILKDVDYAKVATTRAGEAGISQLSIGFTPNAMTELVPATLRIVRRLAPSVKIKLLERPTVEQIREILVGELDMGFISPPIHPMKGLEIRLVERNTLMVAIPDTCSLAQKDKVSLAEIAEEDLVMFPAHARPEAHAKMLSAFRQAGVTPRIVHEAVYGDTRLKLVAAGIGLSIVGQRSSVRGFGGIAFRPILDWPEDIVSTVGVAWRRSAPVLLWKLFEAIYSEIRHV